MNDSLDESVALPGREKPSKRYRNSIYTVRDYCALPHALRLAVDADCAARAGLAYTTQEDPESEKLYTVGRRDKVVLPSSNSLPPNPVMLLTTNYANDLTDTLPEAHQEQSPSFRFDLLEQKDAALVLESSPPEQEIAAALDATLYGLAAVVSQYVRLTPTEGDTEWTHRGPSPFVRGDTDSFAVNAASGTYQCFTSRQTGRVLDFVMFMEECSHEEAAALLEVIFPGEFTDERTTSPEVVRAAGLLPTPEEPADAQAASAPDFAQLAADMELVITPEQVTVTAPVAVDGTIYHTTDYDLFKILAENREVHPNSVRKMVAQITRKNLLYARPIDVTASMEVIDGQHRLAAARELGVPVYYKITPQLSEEDITILNVAQKNWTGSDYLRSWAVKGRTAYIVLRDFMQRHPLISFSNAKMMVGETNNGSSDDFNKGLWKAGDISKAEETAELVESVASQVPSFKQPTNTKFVAALHHCVTETEGFDPKEFVRTILLQPRTLVPCSSQKQFLEMFEQIYNYRKSADKRIKLL